MTHFKNNGKLKLLIIVGTRPEIIRLAAVINECRKYFDTLLAHTGQNYDYNLNGVFFKDLKLADPDIYMEAVGSDLGETMGNIIAKSYQLMVAIKPDAVLVLGDTNSCLSVIGAKRLHIPTLTFGFLPSRLGKTQASLAFHSLLRQFHMEAGNRCKDECLPAEISRCIVDIISGAKEETRSVTWLTAASRKPRCRGALSPDALSSRRLRRQTAVVRRRSPTGAKRRARVSTSSTAARRARRKSLG